MLAEWTRHKTLVVVTHRPQVLQICNRIIVMEQGAIVMDGPRDAVIQRLNNANAEEQPAPQRIEQQR